MRRGKMSGRKSRKDFRSKASRVHPKNYKGASYSMRGGIRL